MTRYWVGVASRDHVRVAVSRGFCQLNHGREAPLRRLSPGDGIVYYSARDRRQDGDPVQAFTAIGEVLDTDVYAATVSDTFRPYRRDVRYFDAIEAPIRPLLPDLSFAGANTGWGLILRRGSFEIDATDYHIIARAMQVEERRAAP